MKLKHDAKAVLCLGPKMCKDKFMQAAARMRQLDRGQQLTIVAPHDVEVQIREVGNAMTGEVSAAHIVSWTLKNTEKSVASWLLESAAQGSQFCAIADKPERASMPEVLALNQLYGECFVHVSFERCCSIGVFICELSMTYKHLPWCCAKASQRHMCVHGG